MILGTLGYKLERIYYNEINNTKEHKTMKSYILEWKIRLRILKQMITKLSMKNV
jgi:hypothetical protein